MKTLRFLGAVGLLVGSSSIGMAQSNSMPEFKSEAEKQAWIDSNPDKYAELNGSTKHFNSIEEKRAWIKANPAEYEAMKGSGVAPERKTAAIPKPERFSSEAEKKAWIEANPEEYRRLNSAKNK